MTGDSGQTGEGVGGGRRDGGRPTDGEWRGGRKEGGKNVEVERQMDQVDETRGEDEMEEWIQ